MPSLVGGGAERTLVNLLQKLDYSRYDVTLVVVSNTGVYFNQIPKQVSVIILFNNPFFVRILAYLQKKTGFSLLFKLVTKYKVKNRYELGISFLDSNFTDLLFFMDLGKRISWVHSSYKTYDNFSRFYKNNAYRNKLIKSRYSRLDAIYFVSQDSMEEFIEVFGRFPVMDVVYNMINSEIVIEKSRSEHIAGCEKFQFIAIGSLIPVKGFSRLIQAASIVKNKGHNFCISIIGSGAEESKLKTQINDLNLNETVSLLGFQTNPYPYLKNGDAFIMSSLSEALPTVLCEAMVLGKPVIATNCSGCRELVDGNKYGLLAEQSADSLAEKMELYLTDPSLLIHYQQMSQQRAAIFDDGKILNRYYQIFDS